MPAVGADALSELAFAAADGDAGALEQLVAAVQHDVYRLALRMVWQPEEAKDATQEALVRIVTRVGSFRGEASFRTWAFRVAANCLLNWRQSAAEREALTFRRFAEDLGEGLAEAPAEGGPDARLLAEEVKLGCTLGMLLCLDREQRLAYVLGDVLGLSGADAAYVCGIAPAAFRQRASRARARLRAFVAEHCGLVNAEAACRCDRRVEAAVRLGRVDPDRLLFARRELGPAVEEMERLHDLGSLMRDHPDYRAPDAATDRVREILASGRFRLLS